MGSLRKIDFGFFYDPDGNPLPSDIHEQQLFVSSHVLVVRRDHPLAKIDSPITEEDLAPYPFASVRLPHPKSENTLDVIVEDDFKLPRTPFVETPYFATVPFVLMESDSYAFMTRDLAESYGRYMPLAILKTDENGFKHLRQTWRPSVVWHSRSNDDHALQWLRATIVEHFQSRRASAVFRP